MINIRIAAFIAKLFCSTSGIGSIKVQILDETSLSATLSKYRERSFTFTKRSSPVCCDLSSPVMSDYRWRFTNSSAYSNVIGMKL